MMDITLEKIDKVVERTYVTYKEAKEALEEANGDVVEAIINIEESGRSGLRPAVSTTDFKEEEEREVYSVEDFKVWIKSVIDKGNISRIKVKKDEKVLVDVPVNAGISAMVIAVILPPVLAFGVIAAVATKVTIEITKCDGSVEVINKYVKKVAEDMKEKATVVAGEMKEKASQTAGDMKEKFSEVKTDLKNKGENKSKVYSGDDTVYTYTVKFDEE